MSDRLHQWDFADAGQWTPSGDGLLAADLFTLTEPLDRLVWTTHNWSAVPPVTDADNHPDAGTNHRILEEDIDYHAETADGMPYGVTDFEFGCYFFADVLPAIADVLTVRMRYNSLTDTALRAAIERLTGATIAARLYNSDGARIVDDRTLDGILSVDTWYVLRVKVDSTTVTVTIETEAGGELRRLQYSPCDLIDGGTAGYMNGGTDENWILGGGPGSEPEKDAPYLAQKRDGSVELDTNYAWLVPQRIASVDRILAVYDLSYDASGENAKDHMLYYKQRRGSTWDADWTEIAADGDVTGDTFTAGDLVIVKLSASNGTQFRTRPAFGSVVIQHTVTVPSEVPTMHEVCQAIKDRIDADGTVSALTGWPTEGCLLSYEDDICDVQTPLAVFIMPGATTFDQIGEGREDDIAVAVTWDWHAVTILTIATLASADPAEIITADNGLEVLTNAVTESLKRTNLSGTVKQCQLAGIERDVDFGLRPKSAYSKMDSIVLNVLADGDLI